MEQVKDFQGNNLKLIDVDASDNSEVSRFNVGSVFYDTEGKIELLEYINNRGLKNNTFFGTNIWEWKCNITPYGAAISYIGYISDNIVAKSVGLRVYNPITGETFEYMDENPIGVARPINFKEIVKQL